MAWKRVWVVVGSLALGCGPDAPVTDGSGGGDGESSSASSGGADGTNAGSITTTSGDTTTDTGGPADSTGTDTSGGPVEDCPPRTLPETNVVAWWTRIDGRWANLGPPAAECVFQQVAPVPRDPGTTELELACTLPDGQPIALTLGLRFEPESLPFEPDAVLSLRTESEFCCNSDEQVFMSLRDPEGRLLLAGFQGWHPAGNEGAEAVVEPIAMQLISEVCLPCEEDGCFTRGALDVTVAGSEPVRIYDGTVDDVGTMPAFRTHLVTANLGIEGIGSPGARVGVVFTLLP